MKIAFWGTNSSSNYSGGRIHAWFMAAALSNNGYEVCYFTNNVPVFYDEYGLFPAHDKINLRVNSFFIFKEENQNFDLIVLIPHLKSKKSFIFDPYFFYKNLLTLKKKNNCPVVKLDFESPNWITSIIPESRKMSDYKYQNQILKHVDGVLSSTQTGLEFAKKYYSRFNPNMKFNYCMPPINSICVDSIPEQNKENKITIITRFSDSHKHPVQLGDILSADLDGYTINVVMGKGSMNPDQKQQLLIKANDIGCNIRFLHSINEKEKFEELKKSKLLLFFTKFEGFGLPPVEAQYCGTKVICSDLPVLREVNGDNVTYVDSNDLDGIKEEIKKCINEQYEQSEIKRKIKDIANFEKYCERLDSSIYTILE